MPWFTRIYHPFDEIVTPTEDPKSFQNVHNYLQKSTRMEMEDVYSPVEIKAMIQEKDCYLVANSRFSFNRNNTSLYLKYPLFLLKESNVYLHFYIILKGSVKS